MNIGVWGYLDEYQSEREEILSAVDRVFGSGRLILGEEVAGFEREFASYHGLEHGVGVDNGTNAIALGLRVLGVGPGDEVITVSNTAAPTVVAIDQIGATAVFVDVDEHYLMDTDQVAGVVSAKTAAIVPVHLYGQCVDMARVLDIARRHSLPVLEDVAQAHGASHHGRMAGSWGSAAAFSFYPTKVLGAYGDGGAVLTDDEEIAADLKRLRYYGMSDRYFVTQSPGFNSRLDEVQAAILRLKLTRLESYVAARRAIAERYRSGLAGTGLRLPSVAAGNDHVYYLFVVAHPQRDRIIEAMASKGIALNVSYPWPVHTMDGFSHFDFGPGDLPNTERFAEEIFSLPMYASLDPAVQDRVIEALREVLDGL